MGILTGEGNDVDSSSFAVELHISFDQGEQGKILALSNIRTRMELVSNLSDEDVASQNVLATEFLYTASLCIRVTTVAAGPLSLLMCHGWFNLHLDFCCQFKRLTLAVNPQVIKPFGQPKSVQNVGLKHGIGVSGYAVANFPLMFQLRVARTPEVHL